MCAMTRDELLLAALATGDTSTAALARATGLSERTCRYGLTHLVKTGRVWSPERGRWRLTDAGRMIASTLDEPAPAADTTTTNMPTTEGRVPSVVDETPFLRIEPAISPEAAGQPPTGNETAPSVGGGWSVPGWLGWGSGCSLSVSSRWRTARLGFRRPPRPRHRHPRLSPVAGRTPAGSTGASSDSAESGERRNTHEPGELRWDVEDPSPSMGSVRRMHG